MHVKCFEDASQASKQIILCNNAVPQTMQGSLAYNHRNHFICSAYPQSALSCRSGLNAVPSQRDACLLNMADAYIIQVQSTQTTVVACMSWQLALDSLPASRT